MDKLRFKKGDKVSCSNSGYKIDGKEGIIIAVDKTDFEMPYEVSFDNDPYGGYWLHEYNLDPVS